MKYEEYTWILVCGIFLALLVAYGIGANDVANAFGTSVGAKAITYRQAIIIAAICEFAGASLMGAGVTDTVRSGIADINYYGNRPGIYMYGMLCALLATGIWLLFATYMELPVSTTHSIIGSIIGFSLVAAGPDSITWSEKKDSFPYIDGVAAIALSWVLSPVLAGLVAMIIFGSTRLFVLRQKNSYEKSLWLLPVYTFITFWIITFFIIKKGGQAFDWQDTPDGTAAWVAAIVAAVACLLSIVVGIPFVKRKVQEDIDASLKEAKEIEMQEQEGADGQQPGSSSGNRSSGGACCNAQRDFYEDAQDGDEEAGPSTSRGNDMHTPAMLQNFRKSRVWASLSDAVDHDIHDVVETDEKVAGIHSHAEMFDNKTEVSFKYLQVFTACANSFAHGSNDVANAMGPFAAIYGIWNCTCIETESDVPEWVLIVGAVGMVLGLATYGYKIMRVLGVKMTKLSNSRGFAVELAAAIVVIIGSRYDLPLSTTHSMVGAITGIGLLEGRRGFNFQLLIKFFGGWVATLLVAGLTAAAFTAQGIYSPNKHMTDDLAALQTQTMSLADTCNATVYAATPPNVEVNATAVQMYNEAAVTNFVNVDTAFQAYNETVVLYDDGVCGAP